MSEMKEDMIELMDEDRDDEKMIQAKLRLGFIRKVYGIIFFQLLITTGVIYFEPSNNDLYDYILLAINFYIYNNNNIYDHAHML